ncbi:hypothetical protein B4166_3582 [Caldibacillus thermoamylovorans]|uniref:Uncharacterized protein n=1 Tax=Caldibacillus thermoamylovorans TaxID=35841 RepID=A0ABD4AAA6_9BACI|nr:hypothetical protein B4166_3582 [Caldibacillus thermoamylovorans]KIO73838.1 hypothetical protein B4167_1785 [Caldibacillus thermoamylovorans]
MFFSLIAMQLIAMHSIQTSRHFKNEIVGTSLLFVNYFP